MAKTSSSSSNTGLMKVLRLIVHLTGMFMFSYGIFYFNYVLKFPKRPDVTNDFAGKMKYLTTINAVRGWNLDSVHC